MSLGSLGSSSLSFASFGQMPSRRQFLIGSFAGFSLAPYRSGFAASPAPAKPDPGAVVVRSFNLLKQARYEDYAAALHPESLKKMRMLLTRFVDFNVARDNSTALLEVFGDAPSLEAIRAMNDAQFLGAFLRGSFGLSEEKVSSIFAGTYVPAGHSRSGDEIYVVVKGTSEGKRWIGAQPLRLNGSLWRPLIFPEVDEGIAIRIANMDAGFLGAGNVPEKKKLPVVVGHVMDGADFAWVVMRMTILVGNYSAHKYRIAPMTQDQPGWSLLWRRDYTGLSRILQANSK